MHELSIAQNIVRIVEEEISTRNLRGAVEKIVFRAGRIHAVVPDILSFNFDVLKKDRPGLEKAVLEVEQVPIRVTCNSCGKAAELEEPFFLCMECGSPVKVTGGQEMWVERIFVKEET